MRSGKTQGERPPIVSIVGKSGSGKTTLIEKLLAELTRRGYRVATIKHDAHSFDVDHPGKDTWRHREAGAAAVAIVSSSRLFLTVNLTEPLSLEQVRDLYLGEGYDLILTEGFRHAGAPKIETHRKERSDELVCDPATDLLIAVASDAELNLGVPVLNLNDSVEIASLIVEKFLR